MSVAQWVFVIIFIIIIPIIVFLIMEFTGFLKPTVISTGESLVDVRALLNPSGWGNTEPVEGVDGQCGLYKTQYLNTLNNGFAGIYPSDCEKIGTNQKPLNCFQDKDTIIARKVRRRCKIPVESDPSPCINIHGNEVPPGTLEEFYEMCPGNMAEGVLQVVKFGFGNLCMNVLPDNETIGATFCNSDDTSQQFRITWRNNVDQPNLTVSNLRVIQERPSIGTFARIYHRDTGKYVNPENIVNGSSIKLTDDAKFAWVRVPPEGDTVQQLAVNINDVSYIKNTNPVPFYTMKWGLGLVNLAPGSVDDISATTQKLEFINI